MKIFGSILDGIDGKLIEVTSDINPERKGIKLLGVHGVQIKEAAEFVARVLPSVLPECIDSNGLITINLSPRESPNKGDAFDLPIAIRAYLALLKKEPEEPPETPSENATQKEIDTYNEELKKIGEQESIRAGILKHLQKESNTQYLLVGGLHLDGRLYAPERGLMGLLSCAEDGMRVIIPKECSGYGYIVKELLRRKGRNIEIMTASTFKEAAHIIDGTSQGSVKVCKNDLQKMKKHKLPYSDYHDFSEIQGQKKAKYALEIAAAGGHNVLLWGPMGEGKTTLAEATIGILPRLKFAEIAEVNRIYTAKGLLKPTEAIDYRPFRPVASGTKEPGLIGGGRNPQPGEISLAHCGVLMINEFNFMRSDVIEKLREPLENGRVQITRATGTRYYPASFTLIATINPCKCSYFGEYECSECKKIVGDINAKCSKHPSTKTEHRCECRNAQTDINPYQNFSSPILNRIDLRVQTFSVDPFEFETEQESSSKIRDRVDRAIKKQEERYKKTLDVRRNSEIKYKHIEKNLIELDNSARNAARSIHEEYRLNTRSYVRLCSVARTVADLKNRNTISDEDIIKAYQVMGSDRNIFKLKSDKISIFETIPREKAEQALKILARDVLEIMALKDYTINRISRMAGIPENKLKSILTGKETSWAESAVKLKSWLERQAR